MEDTSDASEAQEKTGLNGLRADFCAESFTWPGPDGARRRTKMVRGFSGTEFQANPKLRDETTVNYKPTDPSNEFQAKARTS